MQRDHSAVARLMTFPQLRLPNLRTWPLAHLAMLAALPLMLALYNDSWAFTSNSGFIDPWLYTSYFLHLKAQLLAFPGAYYGDRLSDSIPGWTFYHVFGPWIGNYLFKLAVIYTALFSLYFTIRLLFNERVALLCGLLVGAQPYFLMAFGWDYVDGIGIAYYSLSQYFAFRAARNRSFALSMFWSGFFCNCLITSHFLWLNLAGIIPLGFILANRNLSRHSLWKSLASFVAGLAGAFLVFCGIYHTLTGHWFYLANSLRHTLHGFGAAQELAAPIALWLAFSLWMVQYNGFIPLACWMLFRKRLEPLERTCLTLFLTAYAMVWALQLAGFPFAMLLYYTSFLFPVYAIGLGAFLNGPVGSVSGAWVRKAAAGCIAGSLCLYSFVKLWDKLSDFLAPVAKYKLGADLWQHPMYVLAALCFCVMLPAGVLSTKRSWPLAALLTGFFALYALQMTRSQMQGWFSPVFGVTNKDSFRLLLKADAWTDELKPGRRLLWWADNTEPYQGILGAVTSLYLWGWSILNQHFPQISQEDVAKLSQQHTLLVLSWKPDSLAKARAILTSRGLNIAAERDTVITQGPLALHMGAFFIRPSALSFLDQSGWQEVPGFFQPSNFLPSSPLATVTREPEFRLATSAPKWSYVALLPMEFPRNQDEVWIRLRVQILQGEAAFGVLNWDDKHFDDRKVLNSEDEIRGMVDEVMLDVAHPSEAKKLIIETGSLDERTELTIQDIAVFAHPGSTLLKASAPSGAVGKGKNAKGH